MMIHYVLVTFLCLQISSFSIGASFKLPPSVLHGSTHKSRATRWAVLVAGSHGYENYRHQADVCHAYQTLRKGGLKEENIIVFMYDDIAFNKENPRPGVIINHPNGDDVYEGVPKDYTGDACNLSNFFAVLLANRTALKGGSGKVLDSGPDDHIFIYYTDHGGAGVVEMPSGGFIYAKDLIDVLKKKHDNNTYKSMVFYMEACESGSMFEGLLPEDLNIYVTTASKAGENSYATYCSDAYHSISPGYDTCLGDVYSIAWLEDSDKHDLRSETLEKQYEVVRRRTSAENSFGSHVMQFGDMRLSKQSLYSYLGTNPVNDNYTLTQSDFTPSISESVSQRDASLLHFWLKFQRAPEDSHKRLEAQNQLLVELNERMRIDQSMMNIGKFLFQSENEMLLLLHTARPKTQSLVDDWDCLKALVRTYEERCGSLSSYGIKYMRAIANMCNAGIGVEQMAMASAQACMK